MSSLISGETSPEIVGRCRGILIEFLRDENVKEFTDDSIDFVTTLLLDEIRCRSDETNESAALTDDLIECVSSYVPDFDGASPVGFASVIRQFFTILDKECENANAKMTEFDYSNNQCTVDHGDLEESKEADMMPETVDEDLATLCEIYPDTCNHLLRNVLTHTKGDTNRAAEVLANGRLECGHCKCSTDVDADEEIREYILRNFSHTVEKDETYKPRLRDAPSTSKVRYIDNKVVTTKGERVIIIKDEAKEAEMKKTYINLKPLKQYRFH